jgi:hypothetical protein
MVASVATTPQDLAALPGDDSSLPLCPSVPASLCPVLLDHLASPHHSLASIAEHHNLSLSTLLAWLELPAIREKMAHRESIAYRHVRYVAALNLSHAVHTTIRTLEAFNATPRPDDPLDPNYLRAAVHARKAAWLLLRFSRLTPISDLAVAHNTLRDTESVSRYAEGGEPLPVQPVAAPAHSKPAQSAAALAHPQPAKPQPPTPQPPTPQPAHPQPAPSEPPAQSHAQDLAVPTTIDSAAGPDAPADHPTDPAPALPNLVVLSTPALPDPTDMVALVEQLTALAASLGIGVSDVDDPAAVTPPDDRRSPARPTSVHDPGALVTVGPPDST